MNPIKMSALSAALLLATVSPAAAYVGPGLGLGALGAIAAVVLSVLLAVVALVWYPIKRLFKRQSRGSEQAGDGH